MVSLILHLYPTLQKRVSHLVTFEESLEYVVDMFWVVTGVI